jgi:hypothetical protein
LQDLPNLEAEIGDRLPHAIATVQGFFAFQALQRSLDPTDRFQPFDPLVGGRGSLATDKPVRTVGSYWPYATTLFDYIRRAMPFSAPGSLSPDQTYAAVAYIPYLNGIVPDGTALDAKTLPAIRMPNRDGFAAMGGTSATQ